MKVTWSEEAIRALGVRTDVETAGSILGLSRAQSYKRIAAGTFPVPVIRSGIRWIVPTAPIRRLLEMDEAGSAAPDPARTSLTVAPSPKVATIHERTSAA